MSNIRTPSPTTSTTRLPPSPPPSIIAGINEKQKLRTFSPVILFHDHQYVKAGSGDLEHVHIPYGDPSYGRHLDLHKKRIHEMLQTNGRYWLDIITWTRDHPEPLEHSPVPSLVSSPSPPHHYHYNNHQQQQQQHHQHQSHLYNDNEDYYNNNHHHSHHPHSRISSHNSTSTSTSHHSYNHGGTGGNKRSLSTSSSSSDIKNKSSTTTNSNPNNKRRRGNLPKAVTAILRDWLSRHKKHPYPTEEEKASLAAETNLNLNQISNWFINARRRILQPMLEQEEEVEKNELDIMPYDSRDSHHNQLVGDDVYHDRRSRKRSTTTSDILAPTKYPPQKRMTHHINNNNTTGNRGRS